jgi:hypothetical protein
VLNEGTSGCMRGGSLPFVSRRLKRTQMLAKCANPSCSHPFRYLHEGKLYRLELPEDRGSGAKSEWFWLCNQCSSQMTLRMEDSKLVAVTLMSAGGRASSCGEVRSSNNARRLIKSYENTTCTTISMRIEVVNHFEGLRRE